MNENCDVDEKGKIGPVSHLGNYGTYLLSLVMLTTRVKKKSPLAGICIYSCGIVGFTNQRIAFTISIIYLFAIEIKTRFTN